MEKQPQIHLTDRQQSILFAIIEEYAEMAAPVGSVTLAKLFNVSSSLVLKNLAASPLPTLLPAASPPTLAIVFTSIILLNAKILARPTPPNLISTSTLPLKKTMMKKSQTPPILMILSASTSILPIAESAPVAPFLLVNKTGIVACMLLRSALILRLKLNMPSVLPLICWLN